MLKKIVSLLVTVLMIASVGAAFAEEPWDTSNNVYQEGDVETTDAEREAGNPIFVITMEDGSVIRGELYPDTAPQSVGNFIALANSGFYDGLIFHRVIPGFVIQGGDPNGIGIGGPGWSIKGEFSANGISNDLSHAPGVLSMARAQALDSAGSQFFIAVADVSASLDTLYAGFGMVLEGMDVVDAIVNQPRDASDKPNTDQTMATVRVETFGKDYPFDKL